MRELDRRLQRWRIAKAAPWVRSGDRLLDVGCFDRSLIDRVAGRVRGAVGMDPLAEPAEDGAVRVLRGTFPEDLDEPPGAFDCITALAVLEHVEDPPAFAAACHRALAPGGRVVLTVPHPWVDRVLDVLMALRLVDGMSAEEHHGFDVGRTGPLFREAGFRLVARRRFQLGLNAVYVFEKPGVDQSESAGAP